MVTGQLCQSHLTVLHDILWFHNLESNWIWEEILSVILIIFMLFLSFFPKSLTFILFYFMYLSSSNKILHWGMEHLGFSPDIIWQSLTWNPGISKNVCYPPFWCSETPVLIIKPRIYWPRGYISCLHRPYADHVHKIKHHFGPPLRC